MKWSVWLVTTVIDCFSKSETTPCYRNHMFASIAYKDLHGHSIQSHFRHKVYNWRIQVIPYFINLNHQNLDVSIVVPSVIVIL